MRKVSTSLSLFATANVAAVLSFACTGADNSSGPPVTDFGNTSMTTGPIGSPPVVTTQPTSVAPTTTFPATTSTVPTSTATTSTSASSASASSSAATSVGPTSTATQTSTAGTTSVNNPVETSDDEETSDEEDEETSVGNPDGDPGIPIDDDGYFPSNSNVMGFQGSWYCFADAINDTSCVDDDPPWDAAESAMCLIGKTTIRTEEEGYDNWGAGIGASLNDRDGDKESFDAEAKDIKGFKFTLTGELDGATLQFMVPLTNKDSEDRPPEYNITKAGTYSVEFDEVRRPVYADGDDDDPAEPSELYALKWQVKGGETDSSYSICITSVEPL